MSKTLPNGIPDHVRSAAQNVYKETSSSGEHLVCPQGFCSSALTLALKEAYIAGFRDAMKPKVPTCPTCGKS